MSSTCEDKISVGGSFSVQAMWALGFGLRPFVPFLAMFGGPFGFHLLFNVELDPQLWGLYLFSGLVLLINLDGKKKRNNNTM